MKTSLKEGDRVCVKGETGFAEVIKIFPYGGVAGIKTKDGRIINMPIYQLEKLNKVSKP
jgi:hypothetical protein